MKKIIYLFNKYKIGLFSSSISFYMTVAIFSLFILIIQFYNFINNDGLIINKLIEILNPYYLESIEEYIPIFTLNEFSPIIFLNLFWSSSKYINGFNKACDLMYSLEKKRNFIINRISSFIIFLLIIITLIIEIFVILFANKLIKHLINNSFLYYLFQFIIEIFLIFTVIILINKFSPPIKLKFKNVYFGSIISSFVIYVLLIIFLVLLNILIKFNINILSIISIFFLLMYFINSTIIFGFFINYYIQKKPY